MAKANGEAAQNVDPVDDVESGLGELGVIRTGQGEEVVDQLTHSRGIGAQRTQQLGAFVFDRRAAQLFEQRGVAVNRP